jgi:phosphotransferase system enzyme I (PtsI)
MYPMISGIEELRQSNALLKEFMKELEKEGIPFDPDIKIGAMIEIPSAALVAEDLADEVDFFSIGTNDLIQYTLAVDRMNEKIAHLYEPTHPAILKLIKMTADAGVKKNVPVAVCGEVAGDPSLTPLLIGLGVSELSVSISHIPSIKYLIRRIRMQDAVELALKTAQMKTADEILQASQSFAKRLAPDLFHKL